MAWTEHTACWEHHPYISINLRSWQWGLWKKNLVNLMVTETYWIKSYMTWVKLLNDPFLPSVFNRLPNAWLLRQQSHTAKPCRFAEKKPVHHLSWQTLPLGKHCAFNDQLKRLIGEWGILRAQIMPPKPINSKHINKKNMETMQHLIKSHQTNK